MGRDMIADIQRLERALRNLEKRSGAKVLDEYLKGDGSDFITETLADGELQICKRVSNGWPPGETATHKFDHSDGKWHPKRMRNSSGRYEPGRRS